MKLHGMALAAAALATLGGSAALAAGLDAAARAEVQRGVAAEAGCREMVEPKAYDDCIAGVERAAAAAHPAADAFRAGLRFKAWDWSDGKESDPVLLYGDDTEHVTVKAWEAGAIADRQAALARAQALGASEADLFEAVSADADARSRWGGYAKPLPGR